MISLEDFSHLLEVLYSTSFQPENWTEFLNLLAAHTNSSGAYLIVADREQGLSIRMQGGIPLSEDIIRTYAAIAPVDPYRLPLLQTGQLGVLDSDALVSREDLVKTQMYQLLLEPTGLGSPVTMMLSSTVKRMEVISLWRKKEQGRISKEGWQLLELLYPHVQSVLDVRRKLGAIRYQLKGVEAVADASGAPTMLVSGNGRLVHANAAAKALLEGGDGLALAKGRVVAMNPAMESGFSELMRRASDGSEGLMASSAMVVQRSSERAALQVLASPVPTMRGHGAKSGTVLLVVNDPERPVVLPEDAMREMYSLTMAEVEVANGLLTGYSLDEIAALRKVAVGTVRMQLKAIFLKTKTHKQAELVRLLMQMPGVS